MIRITTALGFEHLYEDSPFEMQLKEFDKFFNEKVLLIKGIHACKEGDFPLSRGFVFDKYLQNYNNPVVKIEFNVKL